MSTSTAAAIAVALLAAMCFATAVVFQQEAAVETQRTSDLPTHSVFGLAMKVLRRPIWLLATVVDFAGFLLQATALHLGRLTVVQPILVTVLAFGMLLGAWRSHTRLGPFDLLGVLALSAGLSGFLLAAQPSNGTDDAIPGRLPLVVISILGLLGICVAVAKGLNPQGRAAVLSFGAGASFAVVAALAKELGGELTAHGPLGVLGNWPAYALAVVAISGLAVEQAAFASGPLVPSLVVLTLMDPLASLCTGALVYGEKLQGDRGSVAAASFCGVLVATGVILIARSRATVAIQGGHAAVTDAEPPADGADVTASAEPSATSAVGARRT